MTWKTRRRGEAASSEKRAVVSLSGKVFELGNDATTLTSDCTGVEQAPSRDAVGVAIGGRVGDKVVGTAGVKVVCAGTDVGGDVDCSEAGGGVLKDEREGEGAGEEEGVGRVAERTDRAPVGESSDFVGLRLA